MMQSSLWYWRLKSVNSESIYWIRLFSQSCCVNEVVPLGSMFSVCWELNRLGDGIVFKNKNSLPLRLSSGCIWCTPAFKEKSILGLLLFTAAMRNNTAGTGANSLKCRLMCFSSISYHFPSSFSPIDKTIDTSVRILVNEFHHLQL